MKHTNVLPNVRFLFERKRSPLSDVLPAVVSHDGMVLTQHIREGRFQRSLSLIAAFSSLLSGMEVAYEHYRGSYSRRAMYTPVVLSLVLFVAGVLGALNRRAARTLLPLASIATMLDGLLGLYFHIRGVARKPGGWRIPVFNVVMGPPIFAPPLFAISGFLGLIASMLRREDDPRRDRLRGLPHPRSAWLGWVPRGITNEAVMFAQDIREGRFQRMLAAAAALAAFFSGVEALYSHYKNTFRYKVEWTPIVLAPLLMVAGIGAVWSKTIARTLLPVASLLSLLAGAVGFFYHVRGVLRRPGGLKQPLYNLIYGPPIFAPLLFAASGFLGLLASLLRRAK